MVDKSPIPQGLGVLRGFSVFDPSEPIIQTLKERLGVKLDFLEAGSETILWIGAPDFRYSIFTMGGDAFFRSLLAFLIPFIVVIFDSSDARQRFLHVGVPINAIFAIIVFLVLCGSLVGSVYFVTNRRAGIVFAENIPSSLVFFSRQLWFRHYKLVYFSFKYLQHIKLRNSKIYSVSNLYFGKSIGGNGNVRNILESETKKTEIRSSLGFLFLQDATCSAWNGFYAIRDGERVSNTRPH